VQEEDEEDVRCKTEDEEVSRRKEKQREK